MEPVVSKGRWAAATLLGLVVWAVAMGLLSPLFMNGPIPPIVGPFVAVVPGIIAAGLVVGARSARRWVTAAILTAGLIVAVSAGLIYGFLQSGFMDG